MKGVTGQAFSHVDTGLHLPQNWHKVLTSATQVRGKRVTRLIPQLVALSHHHSYLRCHTAQGGGLEPDHAGARAALRL